MAISLSITNFHTGSMVYWVLETWTTVDHRSAINRAECDKCRNGTAGAGTGNDTDKEKWHGPFHAYQEDEQFANRTDGKIKHHKCCLLQ